MPHSYMKIKNLILFLSIGLIAISCNKDPNDLRVLNLEGEIIVSADQILTSNGPKFSYSLTTVNAQECATSDIEYTLIDQEGELNLILEDISQEEDCASGSGNPVESIPLNIVNGVTEIAISLRNIVKNAGRIETTELQHILKLDAPEGIVVGNTVVNRMPTDVLFGIVSGEDMTNPLFQNLMDSLSQFSIDVLPDGYYTSYFSINNQQAEIIDNWSGITDTHLDVYYRIEDKEAFEAFITQYKENYSDFGFILRDAANGEILFL